jgi:hypothetical protein
LGCAHAAIFAGLCAINGLRVDLLCLFAPPRMSYQKLRDILEAHVGTILAFRNGFDPVPEVPWSIPIFEPWVAIGDCGPDYVDRVSGQPDRCVRVSRRRAVPSRREMIC